MNMLLASEPKSPKQLFFSYLIPTAFAVIVKAILMSVDSVFIGRGVGPLGLAAVGMTMPLNAIFSSLAVFIGIGGAALMSIYFGQKEHARGQAVFDQSLTFLLVVSAGLALIIYLFHQDLANGLGATSELTGFVLEYLSVTPAFYLLHTVVLLLTFFVMNDGNPRLPMYAMFVGIITCIGFDYLFIFTLEMGMQGAALASVITQVFMIAVLLIHFIEKQGVLRLNKPKFAFNAIPDIVKVGAPALLIELAATAFIVIFNYVLLTQYTESHLAAFSIVINFTLISALFFGGISQASQPLFSFSFGEQKYQQIMAIVKLSLTVTLTLGLTLVLLGTWQISALISLYAQNTDPFFQLAETAVIYFILATPFIGLNIVISGFFQAVKAPVLASTISILRGFLFLTLGLVLLLQFGTENGIWHVTLFAESATLLFSTYLLFTYFKQLPLQRHGSSTNVNHTDTRSSTREPS